MRRRGPRSPAPVATDAEADRRGAQARSASIAPFGEAERASSPSRSSPARKARPTSSAVIAEGPLRGTARRGRTSRTILGDQQRPDRGGAGDVARADRGAAGIDGSAIRACRAMPAAPRAREIAPSPSRLGSSPSRLVWCPGGVDAGVGEGVDQRARYRRTSSTNPSPPLDQPGVAEHSRGPHQQVDQEVQCQLITWVRHRPTARPSSTDEGDEAVTPITLARSAGFQETSSRSCPGSRPRPARRRCPRRTAAMTWPWLQRRRGGGAIMKIARPVELAAGPADPHTPGEQQQAAEQDQVGVDVQGEVVLRDRGCPR